MKSFLHVGCGLQTKAGIKGFDSDAWREIRFDIDEKMKPDVVGSLTDMQAVDSDSVDAIYSSHNIEHIYPHEVLKALGEFKRVLKKDGFVVLTCPDLQSVCEQVAKGKLLEPLYDSAAGPISAIDMLYGHRASVAAGNTFMAHKCGFTYPAIAQAFVEVGFFSCFGGRAINQYALWIAAFKGETNEAQMQKVAAEYLP